MNLNHVNSYLSGTIEGLSCQLANLTSKDFKQVNFLLLNENSFLHNISPLSSSTTTTTTASILTNTNSTEPFSVETEEVDYDSSGALYYILFIFLWYGFFIIILIVIQTKMSNVDDFEYSDDPRDVTARNLLKQLRNEDVKKEALEDLRNPGFRQKMWDIYFDNPNTYKIRRVDSKRIQQIDRKLKQLYPNTPLPSTNDYYKTIDMATFERHRTVTKTEMNNLFLLKDLNKFEPSYSPHVHYNTYQPHSTTTNTTPTASSAILRPTITSNFQPTSLSEEKLNENDLSHLVTETAAKTNGSPSIDRFKIEKIKNIV